MAASCSRAPSHCAKSSQARFQCSRASREQPAMKRAGARLHGGLAIALILAVAFLARWSIADMHSYWLDELLSVDTYGIGNESLGAAIKRLATSSIHPPLYQAILYGWMTLFGDLERTTRTLSNV